jgi:hypothetical protein
MATDAGLSRPRTFRMNTVGRLGRVVDPLGHEWEIGHPLGA